MHTPTTGTLSVPGANLYYEVRGTGPALLLIPTGNGDAGPNAPLANALADRYRVITYDKRGYSRSLLDAPRDGPFDRARLVQTDADDAHRLLDHLTCAPANVFGNSSGAIVALALLGRYPNRIRTLVAHEPPLASVLPDSARWLRFYADLYDTYRQSGPKAAMEIFRARMGMNGATRPPLHAQPPPHELEAMLARIRRNHVVWFDNEILTYPTFLPDMEALERASDRLVLAGGSESREHFPYRPNMVLAQRLDIEIIDFPGGHVGHVTHPFEFADLLDRVLNAC
jgi:acetyltransferase/esterase